MPALSNDPSPEARSIPDERMLFNERAQEVLPLLRRVALNLTKDLDVAEDLVQEALVRMWTRRHSYSGKGSYKGWAVVIVCNLAKDAARKSPPPETVPFQDCQEVADPTQDPEEYVWRRHRAAVVQAALQRLGRDERAAVVACCVEGLSVPEAAKQLGVSRKALAGLVRRARQKLQSMEDVLELVADDAG